ncbi:MAG TPA: hypothetical protein VID29_10505 [Solirubrobacteraceae bacterium]
MTDFLDEKRKEINARLAELRPLIDEYKRLEAAAAALDGVGGGASSARVAAPAAPVRRGPGRPKGSTNAKTKAAKPGRPAGSGRRAGRRKGSGTRAAQALSIVQEQPGVTIPELAARMGIKQNYLYRVLPGLEQEGKVAKQGRGWHPASS